MYRLKRFAHDFWFLLFLLGCVILFVTASVVGSCGLLSAQQPAPSPQDEVTRLQWHIRQLQTSRAQCEDNVAVLGLQLDKAQKALDALKAAAPKPEPKKEDDK